MTAKTVLLVGYYGFGNIGDEAILAAILSDLRCRVPDLRAIVVSGDPEQTRLAHGVDAVHWSDVRASIAAAQRSDLVVVGGGGLFQDYWSFDPDSVLTHRHGGIALCSTFSLLATLLDRPLMLYAVGVGPLLSEEGRRYTRAAFEQASVATVRDPESRDLLASLGCDVSRVAVSADPALRLTAISREAADALLRRAGVSRDDRPLLGVALREWDIGVSPAQWTLEVARALDEFVARHGAKVLFLPFQQVNWPLLKDYDAADQVRRQMRHGGEAILLEAGYAPQEAAGILARCDIVFGMRFHAVVFAASARVPVVGLSYDPKVASLCRQLGCSEYALDLDDLSAEELAHVLGRAWAHRREMTAQLQHTVAMLGARSAEDAARAALLLANDAPVERAISGETAGTLKRLTLTLSLLAADQAQHATPAGAPLARQLAERDATIASLQAQLRAAQRGPFGVLDYARRARARGHRFARRAIWKLLPKGVRHLARELQRADLPADSDQPVVLFAPGEIYPDYTPRREPTQVRITRVCCTLIATVRNEASQVDAWVEAIASQRRLPDEIVIVDGGSTDGTAELLEARLARVPCPVRVVRAPGAGIAAGRNLAVAEARYDVVACTDLGCYPEPGWLDHLLRPFEILPGIQVVAGWYAPAAETPFERLAATYTIPQFRHVTPDTFVPSSRSLAFRREVWRAVGGYPEWLSFAGEDTHFALALKRAGVRWAFAPLARVAWSPRPNLGRVFQQQRLYGRGDGEGAIFGDRYWALITRLTKAGLALGLAGAVDGAALWLARLPEAGVEAVARKVLVASTAAAAGVVGIYWKRATAIYGSPPPELGLYGRLLAPIALGTILTAQAIGYVEGVLNRPAIRRRRFATVPGTLLMLAGVPIDDSGGGQRCTQLTLEFLRRGYRVVYLHRFPKYESVDLNLRVAHPNLEVHTLDSFDAGRFFQENYGILHNLLALVEFPLREYVPILRQVRAAGGRVVYDLIDRWDTTLGGTWYSAETEQEIIGLSNVLVASARELQDRLAARSARPVALVPNAVNSALFDRLRGHERPGDLPLADFLICYVGALWGSWFDWHLLRRVAHAYPRAAVVVIGDYRGQCPDPPPNLHFLGLKPQRQIPAYLAHVDVAIVPFRVDEITQAVSPLKVFEYLAMGKPVVATRLRELEGLPNVYLSADADEFIRNIERARRVGVSEALVDAFVRQNSWETRVEKILELAGP